MHSSESCFWIVSELQRLYLESRTPLWEQQQIVARHIDALLNVDLVTPPHNLKGLHRLYDLVESHVWSLKSLGVTAVSCSGLVAPVLLNKLLQDLQLIVSRKIGG